MADMRIKAELAPLGNILKGLETLEKKFQAISKKLDGLNKVALKVADDYTKSTKRMSKSSTDTAKSVAGAANDMTKSVNDLAKSHSDSAKKIVNGAKKQEKQIKKLSAEVSESVKNMQDRLKTKIKWGIAASVGGVVLAMRKAVRASGDFEFGLRKVSTLITGDASESMSKYRSLLLSLSKDTGESLDVLTQGLFDVISASVKGTETVAGASELLRVATKAGIAGASDTAVAVDALTTILNSYNLTADDASTISDKLFTIAKLGKTNFAELAPALGPVVSIAAQAGVSFDELGAALITLTKGGLNTRLSVTAMRAVLSQALTPTKELTNAFKNQYKGFTSIADILSDPSKGFVKFMSMLKEVTGGNADAMARLIPELRGLTGVATLAGTGIDNLHDGLNAMENAIGENKAAYDKMSETFEMKTRRFKALLTTTFVKIGDELLPTLIKGFEEFGKWFENNQENVIGFFKSLLIVMEAVVKTTAKIVEGYRNIGTAAAKSFLWFKNLKTDDEKRRAALRKNVARQRYMAEIAKAEKRAGIDKLFSGGETQESNLFFPESEFTPLGDQSIDVPQSKPVSPEQNEKRKAFLSELKSLEVASLEEIERLRVRAEMRIMALREKGGFAASEMARAAGFIREEAEEKISEIVSRQDERENREIEKQHQKRFRNQKEIDELVKRAYTFRIRSEEEIIELKEDFQEREMNALAEAAHGLTRESLSLFSTFDDVINVSIGNLMKSRVESEIEAGKIAAGEWSERLNEIADGFAKKWGTVVEGGKALLGGLASFGSEIFGSVFGQLRSQITELLQSAIQAASEGKVDGKSPIARLEPLLDKFVSFWENLASNLDGVLEWFDTVAAPKLIDAFIDNLPRLFKALNNGWKRMLPMLIDAIIDIVIAVMDELPSIVDAIIKGIFAAIEKLVQRLPELILAINRAIVGLVDVVMQLIVKGIPTLVIELVKQMPAIIKALVEGLFTELLPGLFMGIVNAIYDGFKMLVGGDGSLTGDKWGDIGLHFGTMGISKLGEFFGLWHDGGMIEDRMRAHNGRFVSGLKSDEVPIIAQTGEAVLNRQATADMGGKPAIDAINSGRAPASNTITNIEVKPGIMLAKDAAAVLDEMLTNRMRQGHSKLVNKLTKNHIPGFEPMI